MNGNNQSSPSAFIPFCDFGGDMSAVGVKIENFDVPVCNSFQPTILNDQICYKIDVHKFHNKSNIINELDVGFNFLLDYNEDRQVSYDKSFTRKEEHSMARNILEIDDNEQAIIYLDTIGKHFHEC